ncbi:MAG: hypothetical protein LH606_22510 [Cytophagaceae bacterium]|nr:hypothetical protein [Cytophagaceae bacterium]
MGLQVHFGSDSVLASGRYGLWRVNFHTHRIRIGQYVNRLSTGKNSPDVRVVEDRYRAEKDRISLQVSYILDRYDGYSIFDLSRRLNLEGRYYFHFRSQFSNSSLFAGLGYYGQDPTTFMCRITTFLPGWGWPTASTCTGPIAKNLMTGN